MVKWKKMNKKMAGLLLGVMMLFTASTTAFAYVDESAEASKVETTQTEQSTDKEEKKDEATNTNEVLPEDGTDKGTAFTTPGNGEVKENWALSTYEGNVSLINNYILPIIGDAKLSEINTRFIERYYQSLLKRRAVINPLNKTSRNEFVSSSTVRDVNKLLRNCFEQAVNDWKADAGKDERISEQPSDQGIYSGKCAYGKTGSCP